MVRQAGEEGRLLDFTFALATRGVIMCKNGVLIKIPLRPMDIERNLRHINNQVGPPPRGTAVDKKTY